MDLFLNNRGHIYLLIRVNRDREELVKELYELPKYKISLKYLSSAIHMDLLPCMEKHIYAYQIVGLFHLI